MVGIYSTRAAATEVILKASEAAERVADYYLAARLGGCSAVSEVLAVVAPGFEPLTAVAAGASLELELVVVVVVEVEAE